MTTPLQLVDERKIRDLFPNNPPTGALEASGVLAMGGMFYVVFDNRTDVARLADDLSFRAPTTARFTTATSRVFPGFPQAELLLFQTGKRGTRLDVSLRKISRSIYPIFRSRTDW